MLRVKRQEGEPRRAAPQEHFEVQQAVTFASQLDLDPMVHFRGTNLLNVWAAAKRAELSQPLAALNAPAGTSSNDNRPRPAAAHSLTAGAETSRSSEEGGRQD